jgi:hypothetical protein
MTVCVAEVGPVYSANAAVDIDVQGVVHLDQVLALPVEAARSAREGG